MGLPENMVPQKPVAITICHTELPYFGAKTYFQTHPCGNTGDTHFHSVSGIDQGQISGGGVWIHKVPNLPRLTSRVRKIIA